MRSAPASVLVITGLFYVTPPPPPGVRWSADWVTRIIIAECHHTPNTRDNVRGMMY